MKCYFVLFSMIVLFVGYNYGYNYHSLGCWCGPFLNWIPQDGQVHYAESRKYESFIPYQCEYLTCVELNTLPIQSIPKTTAMNYAIHRIVYVIYGSLEIVLTIIFFIFLWQDCVHIPKN